MNAYLENLKLKTSKVVKPLENFKHEDSCANCGENSNFLLENLCADCSFEKEQEKVLLTA